MLKIILACGGTGGHIFPAFSVAEELKKRCPDARIVYVCGKKDIESEIFKIVVEEKVVSIESAPARMALSLSGISFLIKLTRGFGRALKLLKEEKPDIVVGFGGHFSFPVVLAAKCLGIRTMIHEQNARPGAANRFLARFADAVALSYAQTFRFLPPLGNARVTGNPVRASIESARRDEALRFFGFSESKKTLLVLGGSQGAESINTLFLEAVQLLSPSLKGKIQVLHLCGRLVPSEAENVLRGQGIQARAFSFFDKMDMAYAAADVALGRAGATFLAEVASKNIPVVLIPYPFGDGHQRENAKIFSEGREAVILEQSGLDAKTLADILAQKLTVPVTSGPPTGPKANARTLLSNFILESIGKNK